MPQGELRRTRPRIAVVAPPWYPVPPSGYGGIELVVHLLIRGLRSLGAEVTLFAREGSAHDAVTLAPAGWEADLGGLHQPNREATYASRIADAVLAGDFDIVHDHCGLTSVATLGRDGQIPVVQTVHGPLVEPMVTGYESIGTGIGLIAISRAQRASAAHLNWVATVHNAVDTDELRVGSAAERDDYVLCLARISPEKGQHLAIEACRRAGRRLVLAGKVGERGEEQRYFEREIAPHIDGDNVIHHPNIMGEQKREILARAYALIHAVTWPEPFGLAMLEAMSSGTPVVGIARGAVPELVIHGDTGILCREPEELASGLDAAAEINRERCARIARARYGVERMASEYLTLYCEIADAELPAELRGTSAVVA